MIKRLYIWAGILSITTVLIIGLEVFDAATCGDPSAMAVFGFLPFIFPLFVFAAAKMLIIPYVFTEVFILVRSKRKSKRGKYRDRPSEGMMS